MKNSLTTVLMVMVLAIFSSCQNHSFKSSPVQNGVTYSVNQINTKVTFIDYNTVRVTKWANNALDEKKSLMIVESNPTEITFKLSDEADFMVLSTENLTVRIVKKSGEIEFMNPNGEELLREGSASFKNIEYYGDKGFTIQQNFHYSDGEGLYGLGQHQDGYMNYRGKEVVLVQSNSNAVNPFLISTKNYGILWDNYSKTVFNDSGNESYLWSDMASNIDYYFVAGNTMDETIAGYRKLTGKAPMYAKWAYGYWQSKEHYDTQHEIDSVATMYRKLKLPIDGIVQDWDYWNGPANWSGMFFDSTLFPKPDELIAKLHGMNYHMMISIWPALGPNTAIYKEMLDKGYLFEPIGWAGFRYYDAFNPAANDLYWKYLKEGLYVKGIDAWWMDSTEPDIINALEKESHEYEMKKVGKNYLGSWARYLNAFSLAMTDAIYTNMRKETDQKRVYILTRSTYAGQQRNAATTWSGDIGASWKIYRDQVSAGINHSMSGIPYWTFDIGAFLLGSYGGVFYDGKKTPAYDELYTRMFQFGAFCPIFRSHGSDAPREMYSMGNYSNVLLKYDNLRYRLLPYIYSLAWKVTNEDYTMMRGLPMDFGSDAGTLNIDDQFMFGPSVMACPVTDFMYHEPPGTTVLVPASSFKTHDGRTGLNARYFADKDYKTLTREAVDSTISLYWYTGRPTYATDSMYSVIWTGKLTPAQNGKHQFHIKTFDSYSLSIDGIEVETAVKGSEKYLVPVELEAGKEYELEVKVSNNQTGAARMLLFWKTPDLFAKEGKPVNKDKVREVYLPEGKAWYDFWTGKTYAGGQTISTAAPIETMPIFVPAGAIIPMGPFLQYATEKQPDPLEIRIYTGNDGSFTLYEDENDTYNYEKGMHATIEMKWDDAGKKLTIGKRQGEFPGMLKERNFNIVLVNEKTGTGLDISKTAVKTAKYTGEETLVAF